MFLYLTVFQRLESKNIIALPVTPTMNPIIPIMAHLNIHEIVVKKIFVILQHQSCRNAEIFPRPYCSLDIFSYDLRYNDDGSHASLVCKYTSLWFIQVDHTSLGWCTVKKVNGFPVPAGIMSLIKLSLARESLVIDMPAGEGKIANLFLQCMFHGRRVPSLIHPELDLGRIVTTLNHHWSTDEKSLFPKHFGQSFSNFQNYPCTSPPIMDLHNL